MRGGRCGRKPHGMRIWLVSGVVFMAMLVVLDTVLPSIVATMVSALVFGVLVGRWDRWGHTR